MSKWLDVTHAKKIDTHTLGDLMRNLNVLPKRVNVRIAGVRTTRSVWILPEEFEPPQEDMGKDTGMDTENREEPTDETGGDRPTEESTDGAG